MSRVKKIAIIAGLGLLFVVVFVAGNNSREDVAVVDIASYPTEPEQDIFVACTDDVMDPDTITLQPRTFVKIFFTNEGTFEQRFGIRFKSGDAIGSTRAIAPETKANFSWRVPEGTFTAQMYCTDHPDRADELTGSVLVGTDS